MERGGLITVAEENGAIRIDPAGLQRRARLRPPHLAVSLDIRRAGSRRIPPIGRGSIGDVNNPLQPFVSQRRNGSEDLFSRMRDHKHAPPGGQRVRVF